MTLLLREITVNRKKSEGLMIYDENIPSMTRNP